MLYIYTRVEPDNYGGRPHVLRTSDDLRGKSPDWESEFCPPFSDAEDELLRKLFNRGDFNRVPLRHHHGWMRFPDHLLEKLIIGCIACDVELKVIDWR